MVLAGVGDWAFDDQSGYYVSTKLNAFWDPDSKKYFDIGATSWKKSMMYQGTDAIVSMPDGEEPTPSRQLYEEDETTSHDYPEGGAPYRPQRSGRYTYADDDGDDDAYDDEAPVVHMDGSASVAPTVRYR